VWCSSVSLSSSIISVTTSEISLDTRVVTCCFCCCSSTSKKDTDAGRGVQGLGGLRVCGLLLCWYSCLLCLELLILSSGSLDASPVLCCCSSSKLTTSSLLSPGSKLLYPKVVSGLQRVTNSAFRSSTSLPLLRLRLFFLEDSGFAMWKPDEGEEAKSDI